MLARMTKFGIRVCQAADRLPNKPSSWVLSKQVIKSSTSIGANYQEAQRSRTTREFLSKLHIALQEAEETRHWLNTISGIGNVTKDEIEPLIGESSEIVAILVASINTTRRRLGGDT